jgi:hypothetical protein
MKMDEDSLKRLWRNTGSMQKIEINSEKLIESVSNKLSNMERMIKRRNRLEIFLAIVMLVLFVWWAIVVPILAVKIGSSIIGAACLLVVFRLTRARKVNLKQENVSDIKFELMVSLQLVKQEFNLLNTVLWWYLLPFFVGIVFIFYAYLHSLLSFSIYTLIVVLIYGFIWYKNKRVAKDYLKPLEKNLTRILSELSAPD